MLTLVQLVGLSRALQPKGYEFNGLIFSRNCFRILDAFRFPSSRSSVCNRRHHVGILRVFKHSWPCRKRCTFVSNAEYVDD